MKIESLFYPYDSVLALLQTILTRKGWTELCVNIKEGTIKAKSERSLFAKHKTLNIKVDKIDPEITNITLRVSYNLNNYKKIVTDDEWAEEKLLDTIDKYF